MTSAVNGIRLAVLDDGLFVRTYAGKIHPVAATFHRFVSSVAEVGGFTRTRYMIPVRPLRIWEDQPALEAVDERRLEVVPTAWFSGIADYLARAGYLWARNWRPINDTIRDSDLLWLRMPASNALLALTATRRLQVPYFGWLAGSVGEVARAQQRAPVQDWLARAVGSGYDAISDLAARGGPVMRLDGDIFASVTTASEVADSAHRVPPEGPPWHIAWAGRMAGEKGLAVLLDAVGSLLDARWDLTLTLVGDGPERSMVEERARRMPAGRVTLAGYVGDRQTYLDLLRDAHVFVHPSGAEGVPKALVEAMTAGVPVIAADVGAIRELLGGGDRGRLAPAGDAHALALQIRGLIEDVDARRALRAGGLAWAGDHTAEREAQRVVAWLHGQFPHLAW